MQNPLSRGYLSLCPFNKALNKNITEEKSSVAAYQADPSKVGLKSKDEALKERIRSTLIDCGYPS